MKKRMIIIADPLSGVKPESDSSLAFAQAALQKSYQVFWCTPCAIHFFNSEICISKMTEITAVSNNSFVSQNLTQHLVPLTHFSLCLIRKDPPFDEAYKNLCWILSSQNKVPVLNSPESLLAFHEKSLPWLAFSENVLDKKEVIPTCVSSSIEVIHYFCSCQENHTLFSEGYVCKPWLGHGGQQVEMFPQDQLSKLLFAIQEEQKNNSTSLWMVQPFLKQIYEEGDRRVLFVHGQVLGSFVRFPAQGKIASNLAQGGKAVLLEMTPEQSDLCTRIGRFLQKKNIAIAGLDLIGQQVGEINITSPTGFRTYEILAGTSIIEKAFSLVECKL